MGTIDANHRDAANWEEKGHTAMRDHKYQKAADDFKKAADALDRAGDRENAAGDYERAADALHIKGDLKGAAHYREKAGADRTNDLSVKDDLRRDVQAENDYSDAGEDRMNAGKAAGRNHKEAAKQYGQAKEDFTKAADAAARIDTTSDDIKKHNTQAALASEKAAAEAGEDHMDAGKAAGRNHKEAAKQYGQAEVDFMRAAGRSGNVDDIKEYYTKADHAGEKAAAAAGIDHMDAGKAAGRNHKEAAYQYGQAKEDFTKAADAATRLGNIDDAKKYSAKADQAGEAAAKQEKLVKPEGGLPAHKNPKNWH
jgi:hypothetical protein